MKARVSLVGAGPGSSDLITVRGLRVLQSADVVLYDALVDEALLQEIPIHVPKIYVGKRCAKHSYTQNEINTLIVESAFTYGHAVRLKGGDPFVFGRASEEIDHAQSFGLPVEVVPGITSAIAVPASQGIPVTKRGVSSSFWVLTATTMDHSFSKDFELAAQSSATLVILMGVRKLKEIAQSAMKYRGGNTPFAVIQNGTLSSESCLVGTLSDTTYIYKELDCNKPGIIVIGEVVADHNFFYEDEIQRVLQSTF
ncbi:uroporphyrinogen-III C-methyltransferase [Allomuricauda sp. NBRC 101325]|uniref:uroporphyrinogen-III C-methyltransferase n=1 Tax=Allomuricauda sp. NBRC 101325 TaxID=1113758 RepID=UPI0024A5D738|nr:uroporphyrinogen-III C-methyltransferase [Muricauda sp. NBRC 101325]GLU42734.1 uroporphyrin-III methyltransferase [Muricauda sp. NBRC 101325]